MFFSAANSLSKVSIPTSAQSSNLFFSSGANDRELYRKIAKGHYELPGHVSNEAKSLLAKILRVNPKERPSCEAVTPNSSTSLLPFLLQILKDSWLGGKRDSYNNFSNFLDQQLTECKKGEKAITLNQQVI